MKGVIPDCLGKLVTSKYGKEKWEDILEDAGLPRKTSFLATQNIQDDDVMRVMRSACTNLDITFQQAADAFGDFWINDYAIIVYKPYFRRANSAKEFLLAMDDVHISVTKNIPNAHPPRFTFDWDIEQNLIMSYHSTRGLIDILVGIIKGVGKYFHEDLKVIKMGKDKVKITFQ